ncbi:hypothetical protein [Kaarinaea lacus]
MMSRILFIIAAFALMSSQNILASPGAIINEPVIACLLALILSPWLNRQFN